MAGNIWGIKQHMANASALAAADGVTGELSWEFVRPLAGKTPDVEFNDPERVFIVTRLADVHNNVMRIYSDRRIEVSTLLHGDAACHTAQAARTRFRTTS